MTMNKEKNNLPPHWSWVKLGEVCSYSKGKMPQILREEKDKECSIPYINIKAFEKGIFADYTNGIKCNLCDEGDLLMVWDGARCGMIGKAKKGAVGSTLMKIKPNENLDKEYLFNFLLSKFQILNTKPKGVGIPHIEPNLLWNFEFVLPPLAEQHRIVAKIEALFSELDKGIESIKTAQQQLKVYRRAVLKWAFEGKLTEEWRKKNLNGKSKMVRAQAGQQQSMAAEPEVEYVASTGIEPSLPKGWSWKPLEQVSNAFGGYAFKSSDFKEKGKYQVIRIGNVRPGVLRLNEKPVFIECDDENILSRSQLKHDDIIITLTGTKKKRDYGFTTSISDSNLLLNQRLAAIRFSKDYLPKFFLYYSWTDSFKDQFFANETGNVGQGNVGMKAVTKTQIPFLSIEEQHQVVSEIESRLSVCDKLETTIEENLQQAEALRQSILKKAFEGRLV